MPPVETLRHVPWTCLWGRFGEPVSPRPAALGPCFVFWSCAHPDADACGLTRDTCPQCRQWRPAPGVAPDSGRPVDAVG